MSKVNKLDYKFFYRRNLPHFQTPGATLFVTIRLADSLPQSILDELHAEIERIEKNLAQIADPEERAQRAYIEQIKHFGRWDRALDTTSSGPHWLRQPEIAQIVRDSLHFLDGRHYKLDAFSIMSNHAHIVFEPRLQDDGSFCSLAKTMHSLKLYTARRANAVLERTGQFWHHERYDHEVRNEGEWQRIVAYVLNNPVKAGMVDAWQDWPWNYFRQS